MLGHWAPGLLAAFIAGVAAGLPSRALSSAFNAMRRDGLQCIANSYKNNILMDGVTLNNTPQNTFNPHAAEDCLRKKLDQQEEIIKRVENEVRRVTMDHPRISKPCVTKLDHEQLECYAREMYRRYSETPHWNAGISSNVGSIWENNRPVLMLVAEMIRYHLHTPKKTCATAFPRWELQVRQNQEGKVVGVMGRPISNQENRSTDSCNPCERAKKLVDGAAVCGVGCGPASVLQGDEAFVMPPPRRHKKH